uniref:Phytochrome B1 n=1 Tax=Rhizophora mucronata TaxID=61149 RepID=A0A2P2QF51_RHIMU
MPRDNQHQPNCRCLIPLSLHDKSITTPQYLLSGPQLGSRPEDSISLGSKVLPHHTSQGP